MHISNLKRGRPSFASKVLILANDLTRERSMYICMLHSRVATWVHVVYPFCAVARSAPSFFLATNASVSIKMFALDEKNPSCAHAFSINVGSLAIVSHFARSRSYRVASERYRKGFKIVGWKNWKHEGLRGNDNKVEEVNPRTRLRLRIQSVGTGVARNNSKEIFRGPFRATESSACRVL